MKVSTEDKPAEQVGTDIGNKAIRVYGPDSKQTTAPASDAKTGKSGQMQIPENNDPSCNHYDSDGHYNAASCTTNALESTRKIKANFGLGAANSTSNKEQQNDGKTTASSTSEGTNDANVGKTQSAQSKGLNQDGSCGGIPAKNVKTMMRYDSTYECVDGQMMTATTRKIMLDHQQSQKSAIK